MNKEKLYVVQYREEIECLMNARNKEEAIKKAKESIDWRFIVDGHNDYFKVFNFKTGK